MSNPQNQSSSNYGTPLVGFQLDNISIRSKENIEWGKQLADSIEATVNGGTSSYFFIRNQRWRTNRNYANGRINMQRFMDLLEFNGKENYINLNWQCIHIVNRIISGLVGRWMSRSEKIMVKAIDTISATQKQEEYEHLEFIIENKEKLLKLQEESGVQLIPQMEGLPEDKEQLRLWQAQFQRIPEEILYELGINDILGQCGWYDVLKEKVLHDSAEVGFVGTYTWMDSEGVIHVEWLKPENCFYSYSEYPDFRDTSWRGYMRSMKISELRKKYSVQFGGKLTEEKLFDIAKTSKQYRNYYNISWNTEWNVTFLRPYDEWNVDVMEFELRTLDKEAYTEVKTKKNGSTIIKKGRPNREPKENETITEDSRINIYRGVYLRTNQIMLEWGLKKNMIRPLDPKEIGNAEFSYSFYMVQSYDMTCIGVPEKIQEPADQMILARLKIQQLVASMVPAGAAINWDAIQNIDYGLGEGNKSIDVVKMFQQTGKLYWRGRDAEGNPNPIPYVEMPNAGFYNQLRGLIELYQFHYQVMKDELGEDPNLITQALQPRVTAGNVEASQQTAEFATDYYYRAYAEVMKDTSRKVSCLLKDSVTYGAKVYRNIVKEEDIDGRIFSTSIQFLPDAIAIQKFELLMNQAMNTTPNLVKYIDPFQMMRIAKEDVKLAETLFRQGTKRMLIDEDRINQQNQQATFEGQIASAKAAEEEKRETKQLEIDGDVEKTKITALAQNQSAAINLVASLMKPTSEGTMPTIPAELKPFINAVFENVMVGAVASTEEQKKKIIEEMQMARQMQEQQMQQQQQMQQEQQPQIQQQPAPAA